MASILDMIRTNDPEINDLRLTEAPEAYCADIDDLLHALKANTVIEYLRVDRDFLPCMELDQIDRFFAAVAALPALQEAQIWHGSIHVKALANFVEQARHIEHLQLGCLDLEGTEEDFSLISAAIQGHPTLKRFSMHDFSLNNDAIAIDNLVATLATVPNLEVVKLEVSASRRRSIVGNEAAARKVQVHLSGKALAELCKSPTLQELHLNRLNLHFDDFAALAVSLKTAPSLKKLSLPHCNLDDTACITIAEAIGQSPALEKIDFSCNKLTDEGCVTLASALKGNQTVTFLRLWGNVKISNAGFDAVREMLEQNCVLERVPLMSPIDYDVSAKISAKKMSTAGHAA